MKAGVAQVNVMLPEEQVHSAQWARSSRAGSAASGPLVSSPSLPLSLRLSGLIFFWRGKKKDFVYDILVSLKCMV